MATFLCTEASTAPVNLAVGVFSDQSLLPEVPGDVVQLAHGDGWHRGCHVDGQTGRTFGGALLLFGPFGPFALLVPGTNLSYEFVTVVTDFLPVSVSMPACHRPAPHRGYSTGHASCGAQEQRAAEEGWCGPGAQHRKKDGTRRNSRREEGKEAAAQQRRGSTTAARPETKRAKICSSGAGPRPCRKHSLTECSPAS